MPDIQRCSEVPPSTPLFESNITFMNYPLDASLTHGAHGLAVDEVQLYNRADIPLEFVVTARDDWKMELSFDPRRFDEDTMQRMLGHVAATLDAFAAEPNRLLGRVPILPEAERRQLLETFNDTAVPFDAALTVVHRLEQAAADHPERPAVEYRDSVLSAGELNARANRIAHRLLAAAELGPDTLVAICMHRSARLMEAILAVWKRRRLCSDRPRLSGGAHPHHPRGFRRRPRDHQRRPCLRSWPGSRRSCRSTTPPPGSTTTPIRAAPCRPTASRT